jgi:DNA repair protein RadC
MSAAANKVKSEDSVSYGAPKPITGDEQMVIDEAISIINRQFERGATLTNPAETMRYLKVLLGHLGHEVFGVLMIDNRNRAICWREMFRGTIDGASVYPREIVKQALADNAAAVILAHNHPSGVVEPSQADIRITERLKKALALVDIRVLDHVIVGETCTALSEQGLI